MKRFFAIATAAGLLLAAPDSRAECAMNLKTDLPARVEDGRIFVHGEVDRHPIDFLVDLAAPTTLLAPAAERLSLHPDNFRTLNVETQLGHVIVRRLPVTIANGMNSLGPQDAVMILGRDFLYQFDVEFDLKNHVIRLFQPQGCESSNLAYWTGGYNVADMVRNMTFSKNMVPWDSPFISPHVTIKAKVNGREVLAALDSGFRWSAVSMGTAHDAGGDTGNNEVAPTQDVLDPGTTQTWLGKFESLAIDQENIAPAHLRYHNFGIAASSDMILGADFFIAHRVLVSYSQRKVYFSYDGGGAFAMK